MQSFIIMPPPSKPNRLELKSNILLLQKYELIISVCWFNMWKKVVLTEEDAVFCLKEQPDIKKDDWSLATEKISISPCSFPKIILSAIIESNMQKLILSRVIKNDSEPATYFLLFINDMFIIYTISPISIWFPTTTNEEKALKVLLMILISFKIIFIVSVTHKMPEIILLKSSWFPVNRSSLKIIKLLEKSSMNPVIKFSLIFIVWIKQIVT